MRQALLTTLKGGIDRLRVKGGASPNSLYDLVNGFVTASNTVQSRPGTVSDVILPAGTFGLVAFEGKMHVFASTIIASGDARYVVVVIKHPNTSSIALTRIYSATPFMGALYVVAGFADGLIQHYWLTPSTAWTANKVYRVGDIVSPTVPNGFTYEAVRLTTAAPVWQPDVVRAVNNVVEPTVANGFAYTVTATAGSAPKSGTTEPLWPTANGATVYEDTGRDPPAVPPTSDGGRGLPHGTVDRYGGGGNSSTRNQVK